MFGGFQRPLRVSYEVSQHINNVHKQPLGFQEKHTPRWTERRSLEHFLDPHSPAELWQYFSK